MDLTLQQLREAVSIREQIDSLQARLIRDKAEIGHESAGVRYTPPARVERKVSPEAMVAATGAREQG